MVNVTGNDEARVEDAQDVAGGFLGDAIPFGFEEDVFLQRRRLVRFGAMSVIFPEKRKMLKHDRRRGG